MVSNSVQDASMSLDLLGAGLRDATGRYSMRTCRLTEGERAAARRVLRMQALPGRMVSVGIPRRTIGQGFVTGAGVASVPGTGGVGVASSSFVSTGAGGGGGVPPAGA